MRERVIVFENYIAAKDQQKSKQRCSMEVYRRDAALAPRTVHRRTAPREARAHTHTPHEHDALEAGLAQVRRLESVVSKQGACSLPGVSIDFDLLYLLILRHQC